MREEARDRGCPLPSCCTRHEKRSASLTTEPKRSALEYTNQRDVDPPPRQADRRTAAGLRYNIPRGSCVDLLTLVEVRSPQLPTRTVLDGC